MTTSEGNLKAPIRHPLDWKSEDFRDPEKLAAEMHRIFDICHGCRRCVNLCTSFPTLFDLIDSGESGELDSVAPRDYWKVVDQCYLCDVCYMTKCPYVPPHPWNVDFPHLMLRAKAAKFRRGEVKLRDRLLSSTDAIGRLAAIPVVAQTVNAVNHNGIARAALEKTLGIAKQRWLPEYSPVRFRATAKAARNHPVRNGERTPGKVAIFSTCYINYNEPGIGLDLLKVLDHNAIPYVIVEKEACCGMPKLELGDLEGVERLKNINIPALAKLARDGYAILTGVPSCTLMFRQELPLMFPDDADVQAVKVAMFEPFEYFVLRNRDGLLKTDFRQPLGKISYHIPCHSRVQNIGQKTRELLQMLPDTTVTTVERCSGHDGTWGVKAEYFENSMKIGRPVSRLMAEGDPDYISSDCAMAARQIEQGIGETRAQRRHPLTLLRIAYGLQ
ncbi:MAG TPA: heterodisulfide reductase-related iron-sulfur binding cluster [Burkholderiales bacterium]|nr:heterodisulfide reductase-related iron-sulfur binding cluster [Burkholderiales bacterium]